MKKSNKFGFTLVELLAVIVILAIILVIAVPKVMSVIEDSKKATLESTAKMIASAAEKAKVQNSVLGKDREINCEDVVKLNDIDYERCIIEFDSNNNALVSIKGKGKFANLYVCEGDKTNAISSNDTCNVEYGNGAIYISKLQAFKASNNGLIIDDTADKNIRYAGSNPNNKVYFNCKDKDSNNTSYGDANYDYANSCEVWRIVGVFDVADENGNIKKRIKLININSSFKASLDSSSVNINDGYGINQWGESTYEDGSAYLGADLMQMLNGYYIGKNNSCSYCNGKEQEMCINDCASSVSQLSYTSTKMIENAIWNLGTVSYTSNMPLSKMYESERNPIIDKGCLSTNTKCNDTVKRTNNWLGKIGLVYVSDYGYASLDELCKTNVIGNNSTCENNNWLHKDASYWTLSIISAYSGGHYIWFVEEWVGVSSGTGVIENRTVFPSLYLSSNIKIIGGNGNTIPYKLSI